MKNDFINSRFLYSSKYLKELYDKIINGYAKKCNLTRPELDVLAFLANNPEFDTARDIVEYRGFSKAYVSKAVEPLIDKNLITVNVNKDDRRLQHIKLTEKAKPLIEIIHEGQNKFADIIKIGISQKDIEHFVFIIEKFMENAINENNK